MIGQTIAHYQITDKLGAGGMGEVYLAQDTKLDRKVAVKLLPAELASNSERRERFMTEAKAASALNHSNVCIIYAVDETADGRPFIVMEFVEGETLDVLVGQGPLEISKLVDISVQIADALDAAHARGIIHRDIKSANISLDHHGQVKVLDFGLAKRLPQKEDAGVEASTQFQTQAGQVLGTPSYMSPEQALGKEVDHRTDLFSLGVVLYELATGRLPFPGSSFGEIIDKIVHAQPEAMARFNYNVTPELERITRKCLQKSPDRRYQSARELQVDLRNLRHELQDAQKSIQTNAAGPDAGPINLPQPAQPPPMEELKNSDIYISCALIDDEPLSPGKEGWISQFQRNLKLRLEQLSGERVKVWSYPMPSGKAPADATFFQYLPDVKTMVSVVSPPFVKSEGCWRGVEEFWQTAERSGRLWIENKSRIFKVVKTPVDVQEMPPRLAAFFQQLMGFEFFERDPESGRFREFNEAFGEAARQRYYERVYDLAYEICQVLKSFQTHAATGTEGALPVAAIKIYLAETTSDLQAERDRLQRELIERGVTILPDRPLPLVAAELEQVLRGYLEQCDLAIHMVGERYGVVPEEADRSLVALQNQLAAQQSARAGLERLVWMPKHLRPRDQRQAAFIQELIENPEVHQGAEVIEDTLENLKELLEDRWSRKNGASQSESATPSDIPRVYLICDRQDEAAIEPVEDYFYAQGVEVSLPEFEQDESTVSQIHWQNLQDCDAVLIYYGTGGKSWVDIKLRDLVKAVGYREGRPIELQAVYIAPPIDRRKERFKTLSAAVIRQAASDLQPGVLDSFINRVKQLKEPSRS